MASSACGADSLLAEDGLHLLSNAYGSTQTAAFDCQVLPKCEVSYTVTPVPNIPTYIFSCCNCFSTTTTTIRWAAWAQTPPWSRQSPSTAPAWLSGIWMATSCSLSWRWWPTYWPTSPGEQLQHCKGIGWNSRIYSPSTTNTNPLSRSLYMVGSTSPRASCSCCGRNSPRRYSSTPPTATCVAASSTQPCATRSSPREALIQRTSRNRRPPLLI